MRLNCFQVAWGAAAIWAGCLAACVDGAVFTVTVDGPDAIFLAGRTDVVIPPASDPWTGPAGSFLVRHAGSTPEEALESLPPFIPVAGGDVIRVLDPAIGGINFFNGFGPPFFGPSGNGSSGSNLSPLAGISGYIGPQGPLAGAFLDNSIPNSGPPPATLDFTPSGLGTDFTSLTPALRQIFYIGDGVTSGSVLQQFVAPPGATRLFFAIPDGFGFVGAPGAYDDNDGSYTIRVGVNEIPTAADVPEPASGAIWLLGVVGAVAVGRRRRAARSIAIR
jgi:MYXO-CTERM domain-containing protein